MIPSTTNPLVVNTFARLMYYWYWGSETATNIWTNEIWVGNIASAWDRAYLEQLGITHVVAITQFGDAVQFYPDLVTYHSINLQDEPSADILHTLDQATQFIHAAVAEGGRVLIHCNHGRSRSVTVAAAYLMAYKNKTDVEALNYIRALRPVACPNPGFQVQLGYYNAQQQKLLTL